jgi:hypothetical protein
MAPLPVNAVIAMDWVPARLHLAFREPFNLVSELISKILREGLGPLTEFGLKLRLQPFFLLT